MRSLADAARAAGEHIRSLRAEGGPPEGMLLPALRAVVAAAGAAAGAVCRLEPEVEALRLAAEVGLSDEGCRHLRWLRPDGPWDVPLRSLREQRAQVSDPASGGPASPPLVEPVGARAVACIPLFAGAIPAGTLVLVGDPHAFDRACLDDLEPAAEELAAVLAAIPEPSAGEGVGAPRPADEPSWLWGLAESACRSLAPALQELGSLVGRIRPAAGDAAVGSPPPVIGSLAPRESLLEAMAERALQRIRPAVEELAAVVEGTRRRVTRAALPVRGTVASLGYGGGGVETAALAEVTEERDRLAAERAELALAQVALEQARAAEVGGLMARLAEAEAVMVRERERVGELERAQEGLIAELAEAITRELRTREEAQALAARAAADREETLQRARESTQAAESARAAAAVEAEALRTALAQAQTLIMEAEDDARAARAACDLLQGAEQVRSAERDQLAHDLEEARARAVEDAGRLTRLEREIGALHEERLRLQASGREREAEIAAEWTARLSEHEAALARTRERVLELERAHDLLAERLAAAVSREERAQEELQAVTARAAAGREETLARARESTQAAESARAAAAAEAEALRAALAQAQAVIMEAEDQARQARVREDEARAELGRLEQDLRAAQEERNRLEVAAHEKERTLRAHWTARLSDRETTATQQREQIAALEAAQAELVRDLGAAAAREQRAREELEALAARAAADREETLARARESTQAAESARAAAAAEAEALRAALAQAQAVIMEAEDETRQARATADRARAEAAAVGAERANLQESLEAARAREAEVSSQLATLECDLAALHEERARLAALAREQEAEITAEWTARLAEQETLVAAERERIAELERAHVRLSRDLAETTAREQKAREELEALAARSATDREETLARARESVQAAEAARAVAAAEAETVRAALAQSQSVILEAEDQARQARAELERLQAEGATVGREREELRDALEEARARAAEAESRLTRLEGEVEFLREERARLEAVAQTAHQQVFASGGGARQAPPAMPPRPTAAAARKPDAAANRRVAVVDSEAAATGDGADVAVTKPGDDLGERLRQLDPGTVLVNLAAPGALAALAAARAAGVTVRARGYLGVPGSPQAVALGGIEVGARPLDGRALAAQIAAGAAQGTRVLAAGSEADAFLALRQALTRHGVSVSIAWDAKQATDLLAMVRPQIVVLDLGLPPRNGYGLVAQLATVQPLPDLVCILRDEDPAEGFAAELPALLAGPKATTLERVIAGARGRA